MRVRNPIKLTAITRALRAAKQAGLQVTEFRIDPSTGIVSVIADSSIPETLPQIPSVWSRATESRNRDSNHTAMAKSGGAQ